MWLIYTHLFTEADKQISDLFQRLKFSLAVNNQGVVEKTQLEVKMSLGIQEVISMGSVFAEDDPMKNNLKRFDLTRELSLEI